MPRLRLEIRDFDDLVRDLANLHRPLFSHHYSYRKWFFQFKLEVTLHELQDVRAAGPVVIETEVNADATRLLIDAWIPKLYVKSSYTVAGGGILIKADIRSLEVEIDGGLMGDIQLADPEKSALGYQSVLDLQGFRFKFHLFPAWLERRLQRPIERALERALARLIGDAVVAQRRQLGIDGPAATVSETAGDLPQLADERPQLRRGRLAHLAYRSSYCLAYGLVFPVLWTAAAVPAENAAVEGLRDGARSAKDAVAKRKQRRAAAASSGRHARRPVALAAAP